MRLIVCGGRDFGYKFDSSGFRVFDEVSLDLLFNTLEDLLEKHPELFIIQGGARGADYHAKRWAIHRNVPFETFNADWDTYHLAAGSIRNTKMITHGKPDKVLACPGSKGTANMIKQAISYDIPVLYLQDFK
jgi:hypothetical protein